MSPDEIEALKEQVAQLTDYHDYVERKVAAGELPLIWTQDWESELDRLEKP